MPLPKTIYFHEDDYCQIEILPFSLWDYCVDEMEKIDEFSKDHKTEFGWSDIYLRNNSPGFLSDLSIPVGVFKERVEKTLTPYSKVSTGYSSYVEDCDNCLAWGMDEGKFTIFVDFNNENLISAAWLDFGLLRENTLPLILDTFNNLPRYNELMIADWRWSKVACIGDNESLRNYLVLHK